MNFGATTLLFQESLGTDTGRAIGAAVAEGDILLFMDGDFVIPPPTLPLRPGH